MALEGVASSSEATIMMRMDEARGLLMQALRESGWNQVGTLVALVGDLKARAGGINPNQHVSYLGGRQFLESGDETLLTEVIWSLIIQGILVPGINDANPSFPFIRLTEYGRRCVAEDRILPHDPDGYLREFQKTVPGVDPTITEYLTEALQCYIHGLNRAAAVMLGGASEQAVLLLIESCMDSVNDSIVKLRFESDVEKASSIFRKYDLFEKRFSTIKSRMPRELSDNVDSQLRGVFDLIRSSRNDAGHPASGGSVGRDAVYSHLCLFTPYSQRIYGLIDWFSANKT
jgi:hypothetical protein